MHQITVVNTVSEINVFFILKVQEEMRKKSKENIYMVGKNHKYKM